MKKTLRQFSDFIFIIFLIISSANFAWALDDLSSAAMAGDKVKLEALIASGAEVKGEKGAAALYWAAARGKYETATVLIAHGADVNAREPLNGFTPLHRAVSYVGNSQPRAQYGGARFGALVEVPPMDVTAAQNKRKFAELLIAHGADVNARSKGGITPLHEVASKEMVELLIRHGANVNPQTSTGGSAPLFSAISRDSPNKEIVVALLTHGAAVDIKNQVGQSPLHYAVQQGKEEIVELLIANGADVNAKDREGRLPLNLAIQDNKVKLAALLLAHGSTLDAKPQYGLTELHWAASKGNKQMVELMLVHGARINAKDQSGRTPLRLAIDYNHEDIAKLLIAKGADMNIQNPNGAPLIHGTRDKEMLESLLSQGANANAKDSQGNSLLWYVCYDSNLTELLLRHGADINIKNSQGRTALHLVARFARDNVAEWLLAHDADVNAKDDSGQTPLFHAVRSYERHFASAPARAPQPVAFSSKPTDSKQAESVRSSRPITAADDLNNVFPSGFDTSNSKTTVKLLLKHGADVNATDRRGQSLLHVAPDKDIAELLLVRRVAVNAKRTDGATALHLAAVYGRKEVVQVLLAHGADVNAKTKDGITPLHYAKGSEVTKLLLASGAKVDVPDNGGNTPLYTANESAVVRLLLANDASINAKNLVGQTPLLRMIRTYISNLPAHSITIGPLDDLFVVTHGGANIEVIKALLDHGADVNLDDREGYTPLFYVREAKKGRAYIEVIDLLNVVEELLVARGAKLEKRKKESVPQSQKDFPPELAGIPQIELGTRVMMQVAVQYEERQKAGKENHLYYRESLAMPVTTDNSAFDDHLQLLDYFKNLPADVQKNGLWIKRFARNLWTQPDADRLDEITQYAKPRKISLFLCEPKAPKNSSWLVSWDCDQVSPQSGLGGLSCEAIESKGQLARWECRKKGN